MKKRMVIGIGVAGLLAACGSSTGVHSLDVQASPTPTEEATATPTSTPQSATPTPVASATPFDASRCQAAWIATDQTDPNTLDVFVVDMPIGDWVTGNHLTNDPATDDVSFYLQGFDEVNGTVVSQQTSPDSPVFTVVDALHDGAAVRVFPAVTEAWFDVNDTGLTTVLGAGGNGFLDTTWMPMDGSETEAFDGVITMLGLDANFTITSIVQMNEDAFAICYQDGTFGAVPRAQRIARSTAALRSRLRRR